MFFTFLSFPLGLPANYAHLIGTFLYHHEESACWWFPRFNHQVTSHQILTWIFLPFRGSVYCADGEHFTLRAFIYSYHNRRKRYCYTAVNSHFLTKVYYSFVTIALNKRIRLFSALSDRFSSARLCPCAAG